MNCCSSQCAEVNNDNKNKILFIRIQRKRPDLRLIISSATLDAEGFFDFFNTNDTDDPTNDTAVIMSLEGRMFPIDVMYTEEPVDDYIEGIIQTVFDIHTKVRIRFIYL